MLCFVDAASHPFRNIPSVLLERKGREMAIDSLQTFGVLIAAVGPDGLSFDCDLSRSDPRRFMDWTSVFSICRCDISRATDFICFLGKSPLSLQICEAFSQGAIPSDMITALTPDEVFETMQSVANAVLAASNERIETLRGAADAGIHSAKTELESLERSAEAVMAFHGFKMPKPVDDPLGPGAQLELSDEQRRQIADEGWGDLSGLDDASSPVFDPPGQWDGF